MGKEKITQKLFVLTLCSLMGVLAIQFLFQTVLWEGFYLENKEEQVATNLQELGEELIKQDKEINKQLLMYAQEFDSAVGIVDLYGRPVYGFNGQQSFIEVVDLENKKYTVYIDHLLEGQNEAEMMEIGEDITIEGVVSLRDSKEIYPLKLEAANQIYTDMDDAKTLDVQGTMQVMEPTMSDSSAQVQIPAYQLLEKQEVISGIITESHIIDENFYGSGYRESQLRAEASQFIYEAMLNETALPYGEPIIYRQVDTYVGVENLMGVLPLYLQNQPAMLVSMVSLQPVEEAIQVMNQFSMLLLLVVFIVAVILAYFYARNITRPLVELRNVTTDIANLNFSQKCQVRSKDEIGQLADNINCMSDKLKDTLEELQQDIQLKDELNQQRKQFIMDGSHELKTPITVLKATCEGMLEGVYDGRDKSIVYPMLSQINDMEQLVQQLIDSTKIEREESLKKEVFEVTDTILRIHHQLKPLVQEKRVKVALDLDEGLVWANRQGIETVVRNLYNNAVFYTPNEGSILIETVVGQDEINISIENSGVGIPKQELEKVWEAFYRVEQSRNRRLGGSGLGLYIVKQILEQHNCSFGIGNTDDGVRVWFTLPIVGQ